MKTIGSMPGTVSHRSFRNISTKELWISIIPPSGRRIAPKEIFHLPQAPDQLDERDMWPRPSVLLTKLMAEGVLEAIDEASDAADEAGQKVLPSAPPAAEDQKEEKRAEAITPSADAAEQQKTGEADIVAPPADVIEGVVGQQNADAAVPPADTADVPEQQNADTVTPPADVTADVELDKEPVAEKKGKTKKEARVLPVVEPLVAYSAASEQFIVDWSGAAGLLPTDTFVVQVEQPNGKKKTVSSHTDTAVNYNAEAGFGDYRFTVVLTAADKRTQNGTPVVKTVV